MGLLDEAIGVNTAKRPTTSLMLDRVLVSLSDFEDHDRLLDMLAAPVESWGHEQMAGIIRHVCDELGVDHEGVKSNNVGDWRRREWRRVGS